MKNRLKRATGMGPALVRAWRRKNGWSAFDLGEAIGYADENGTNITRFERGERPLPIARLVKLADVTGIQVGLLVWPEQAEEWSAWQRLS